MDSTKDSGNRRGVAYQIPRNTLALLMVAQVFVVAPYVLHLSPWLVFVGLFCGYWRTAVYQGRWDYPRRWVKAGLVGASVVGVAISGAGAFSLEAAASLLILAFALKLIEMKSRRDAYVVIFLGYFVIATQFLFDQSIGVALYEFLAICVVTAAMVGLNQLHTRVRPLASLRLATRLVLQALPLTVVVFLFFPRIAPLWSVPLPSSGKTGITDVVKPGDIAALTQSDELAFRVEFAGDVPPARELYWRGLVYSTFEDGAWSVGAELPVMSSLAHQEPAAGGSAYEVLLEPTMSNWLFAMAAAFPKTVNVKVGRDFGLRSSDPVMSVFRYRVRSYPDLILDPALDSQLHARETRIDTSDNPRTAVFAEDLYQRSGSTEAFIDAVLAHIRQQPFRYTLNPPALPDRGGVDGFWFRSRAGFCAHYASAFVYMMRSVGIPARMVGGYQGGEINPITGHLVVRQYDAHAWAEVWMPRTGWMRVDPTAAVAPDRIDSGLTAALSSSDLASLSALTSARLGDWSMVSRLLYWADSLEHRWNLWVIGYDNQSQSGFLRGMLGELTRLRVGVAMIGGGAVSVGLVALSLFWRRRPSRRHPVERLFLRFVRGLSGQGIHRRPDESPGAFILRAADQTGCDTVHARAVAADVDALLYDPSRDCGRSDLHRLRSRLRRLQFRLAFTPTRFQTSG